MGDMIKYSTEGGKLTIFLQGRIDSKNAADTENVIKFYRSAIFYKLIIAARALKSKMSKPKAFLRLRLRNNKVAKQKQKRRGSPLAFPI